MIFYLRDVILVHLEDGAHVLALASLPAQQIRLVFLALRVRQVGAFVSVQRKA
jgi:hypothetical protein